MDFSFFIKEGLNIFVGPNSSGKTNIVSFFEFISFLTEEPVGEAIIRAGGVSSVFRTYSDPTENTPISIRLEGEYAFLRPAIRLHQRKGYY
jgi:predicted ATPase